MVMENGPKCFLPASAGDMAQIFLSIAEKHAKKRQNDDLIVDPRTDSLAEAQMWVRSWARKDK
jgi:hypothetical protein